eukprot:3902936-Pyramimonas_sp.AAC.1
MAAMARRTFQQRRWPTEIRPEARSSVVPVNWASGKPCSSALRWSPSAASWACSFLAMFLTTSSQVPMTPALST